MIVKPEEGKEVGLPFLRSRIVRVLRKFEEGRRVRGSLRPREEAILTGRLIQCLNNISKNFEMSLKTDVGVRHLDNVTFNITFLMPPGGDGQVTIYIEGQPAARLSSKPWCVLSKSVAIFATRAPGRVRDSLTYAFVEKDSKFLSRNLAESYEKISRYQHG